jgi:predicted membrane protein
VATGFQRSPDGKITVFAVPGAGNVGLTNSEGTWVFALNIEGTTTGDVGDANAEHHSFVRDANGKITVFDLPGQLSVPGSGLGSAGEAINDAGVVAGEWHDANYVAHGFIRLPKNLDE